MLQLHIPTRYSFAGLVDLLRWQSAAAQPSKLGISASPDMAQTIRRHPRGTFTAYVHATLHILGCCFGTTQ
ncbi:hypothetical protein F4824DRAFT_461925 [Ustulina deusta]|nr:hypothetical protein F4824DRAFT_461925 [Ustulina deusta]